jgi:hypothetical protein
MHLEKKQAIIFFYDIYLYLNYYNVQIHMHIIFFAFLCRNELNLFLSFYSYSFFFLSSIKFLKINLTAKLKKLNIGILGPIFKII